MYKTFNITPNSLTYKTYYDLSIDIKNNLYKLPENIDLIVGIPRSGMFPASIISMYLSKPLCTLESFIDGNYHSLTTSRIKFSNEIKNVLIVDDSISFGQAISKAKKLINENKLTNKYNIKYLAIYYKTEDYRNFIDVAFEKIPSPRLFQWNYLNHVFLQDAAFDIDGVLCYDPTNEENDDGDRYRQFILNARPLFIPQYKIAYIITSRLEKYKEETKEWLKKNNVQYDHLIMLSGYTAEQRKRLNLHAKFKAEQYKKLTDIQLFIESNRNQAQEISRLTNKLCFCATTDELFGGKR